MPSSTLAALRQKAVESSHHAYVPYSADPEAAAVLFTDGSWLPGVRVESASYSLLIPSVVNALTTAVAMGRHDIAAVALSRPVREEERVFLESLPLSLGQQGDNGFVRTAEAPLPPPGARLRPFLDAPPVSTPHEGVARARRVADRAQVPVSDFPVGCVLETDENMLVPGVNVEYTDWTRILCAERNALGTAVSYGICDRIRALYLSCTKARHSTPCGACRQLIVELLPQVTLWMHDAEEGVHTARPDALLPGNFAQSSIRSSME